MALPTKENSLGFAGGLGAGADENKKGQIEEKRNGTEGTGRGNCNWQVMWKPRDVETPCNLQGDPSKDS